MYCVFRIRMEEYIPGLGYQDDGCIYSLNKIALVAEAERRTHVFAQGGEKVKANSMEIVIVHESFLANLRFTPVLSTTNGKHPADQGTLAESNDSFKYQRLHARREQDKANGISRSL
jgi:hypothetical protein